MSSAKQGGTTIIGIRNDVGAVAEKIMLPWGHISIRTSVVGPAAETIT